MRRYERPHINEVWCGDTSVGPYLKTPDGKKHKVFIIALIDDASRFIVGIDIFFNDNFINLIHMRFCDLFISYKIGLKDTKSTIPFTKLPLYRKVFLVIFLTGIIISGILLIFIQNIFSFIPMGLSLISLIIFAIIDSRKDNLSVMLENHYIPYSEKRMNITIEVLKKYNIDIKNLDSLDMLIMEAKYAQIQCDLFSQFKKPFKTLGAIIIPIVVFVAKKISETATETQMLNMAVLTIILILLIFSLIFSFVPIVKDIFYIDYNRYDEFIYDLRQIKLFYPKN